MRIFLQRQNQQEYNPALRSSAKASLTLNHVSSSRFQSGYTTGIQGVQRYSQSQQQGSETAFSTTASRFAHDFSRIPAHAPASEMFQGKQADGEAGGKHEQKNHLINDNVASNLAPVLTQDEPEVATAGKGEGEPALAATGYSDVTEAEMEVSPSPRLTKVTVAGPTPGPCGNFKWAIKWELDKKTTKGGLIVQKINSQFDVKSCKGKPYELPKEHFDPNWFPFWEAWEIKKNEKVTNQGTGDDLYKWPFALTDSTGTYTTTGSAEFYDGAQLSKTSFKVMNKPPGGILPMTKIDPKLPGGTGSLTHNLKATWDCCSKGKTKTGDTILETE